MNQAKFRQGAVLAMTILLLALPVLLGGIYVLQKYQWAQSKVEEVEPRYARLLGLGEQRAEFDSALISANEARARYVYPASQNAGQAGNAAQQRLREIFSGAGLQISSSQVLPSKVEKGFERIPLTIRTEGDLVALQSALAVLSSQTPLIIIDQLEIQVLGGLGNVNPKFAPQLAAQFSLSVLRERS